MPKKNPKSYLWYASYGSNLSKARFMCYIKGGTPVGSTRKEVGCKDKSPPKGDETIKINHSLYFAERAEHWENMGVAFINKEKDVMASSGTLGRMYLITKEQFLDVVKQENRGVDVKIDLDAVKKAGSHTFRQSWYGNILYLGNHKGNPIFSFTTYKRKGEGGFIAPSSKYLKVIASGLKEAWNLDDEEIADYFVKKMGIKGNFSKEDLKKLF